MNDEKRPENESHPNEDRQQMVMVPVDCLPLCNQADDEIDLRQLFSMLWKRKWLIGLIAACFIILALIYVLAVAKPVYEARATIEIGHTLVQKPGKPGRAEYFENALSLKQCLDTTFDTAGKYRKTDTTSYIDAVTVPKKLPHGFLTITAVAPDNRQAIAELKKVIGEIIQRHQNFYNAFVTQKQIAIEALKQALKYSNETILPRLEAGLKHLETVEFESLNTQQKLITNEVLLQKVEEIKELIQKNNIPQLETRIRQLETTLIPPCLVMTRVVGKIYTHDNPVKPKKKLILALAGCGGLMLGIFLAFALELFRKREN